MKVKQKKYMKILKRGVILIICVLILSAAFFFGVQIYIEQFTKSYIIQDISNVPESDAVMVLGALVYSSSGKPSPVLKDRLDYGYELYMQGKTKKILVSGDNGQPEYDEVNVMKNYLLEKGVPREDIFMDHAGFNTYDSMYRAKEIFCIETLLISTQDFHLGRAVYIARKMGIDAYGYSRSNRGAQLRQSTLRESFARVKAVVDVAIKRKPKYLGDKIPIGGDGILTEG
jgi:vancomycin permeability regulator SanA